MKRDPEVSPKTLRDFGLMVGGIFLIIGLWPVFFQEFGALRLWALIAGGFALVPALVFPAALRQIYRAWMVLGHAMGWMNTRLILAIFFYVMVTPMGCAMRLFGKDPMSRKMDPDAETYRVAKSPRPASHMRRQF